ncbi:MAG: helix-turn-helix domain-containing protein [Pseudomonadota bacterium]
MTRKQRHQTYENCPIEAALDVIGGKWKASLLFSVSEETRRFSALLRLFPKISQRTLTNQLRELEADGLIHRKVYAQVPPKVEYSLTDRGRDLVPALVSLATWGTAYAVSKRRAAPV